MSSRDRRERSPRSAGAAALEALEARLLLQGTDDLVFLHHSCGQNWLDHSLDAALPAKGYIDERNDITYGTAVSPDAGRPDSLGAAQGDSTDMCHWILWFNDYLASVQAHGCSDGANRIILFKSCYPNSHIEADGAEPGDPLDSYQTLANYRAIYRHPAGSGSTYMYGGYTYEPLEDVFARNPDTLFIPVTAPPLHYAPVDDTDDAAAHRARTFNNWLKNDWLTAYNTANPGLNNVAVFDWFDVLAYPDDDPAHPNRLQAAYGGDSGNSHPNDTANGLSTQLFATNPANFLDQAWDSFAGGGGPPLALTAPAGSGSVNRGDAFDVQWSGGGAGATLGLWDYGPIGLQQVAAGLSAGDSRYEWSTAAVPCGWHCFVARVSDGGDPYVAASPGWVSVVDVGAAASSLGTSGAEVLCGLPAGPFTVTARQMPLSQGEPERPDTADLPADVRLPAGEVGQVDPARSGAPGRSPSVGEADAEPASPDPDALTEAWAPLREDF